MAKTPQEMRQDVARKQVRFSQADVDASDIRSDKLPDTPLQRRSSLAAEHRIPDPNKEVVSTVTIQQENEDGELADQEVATEPDPDIREVLPMLTDGFTEYRYLTTEAALDDDLAQKISDLAAFHGSRERGPAFHFKAITEEGQGIWPDYNGPMDLASFEKRVEENTTAMFAELKFRGLALSAARTQIREIHVVAREVDHTADTLRQWVLKAAQQISALEDEVKLWKQASQGANPGGRTNEDGDDIDMQNEILQRDERIRDLAEELAQAHQNVNDLFIQTRNTPARSAHTNLTEGGTHVKRTAKVEDAPKFHNDKDKDDVPFDLWLMQADNRVIENADWFATEASKVRYYAGRLAGRPAFDIVQSLNPDNPERIATVEQMREYLMLNYADSDRRRRAQNEWDTLRMMDPKTYHATRVEYQTFKNTFMRLATEVRLPRAAWKDEFERRLSPTLQKALAVQFLDEDVDFNRIVALAQKVDFANVQADSAVRLRREQTGANGNGNSRNNVSSGRGGSSTGTVSTTRTARTNIPRESKEKLNADSDSENE